MGEWVHEAVMGTAVPKEVTFVRRIGATRSQRMIGVRCMSALSRRTSSVMRARRSGGPPSRAGSTAQAQPLR